MAGKPKPMSQIKQVLQHYKRGVKIKAIARIVGISKNTINNSPSTINNGLVGYWPFNGNANDESGNGNNGTVNGASLSSNRFDNALNAYEFDGTDNYIDANILNLPFNNSERSITGWFKTNSPLFTVDFDICIFNYGNLINGDRFALGIYSKGNLQTMNGFRFTNEYDFYVNNKNFLSNDWYFFTLTYDQTKTSLYVNGELISSKQVNLFTKSITNLFRIGSRLPGDSRKELFRAC